MKSTAIRALLPVVAACFVTIFSYLPAGAASITLPATNQTTCYDQGGALIPCVGTKQDGALRMGAAWPAQRFSDNNDGTFTDSLTGLVWLIDNTCLPFTNFLTAMDTVSKLADGQCGLTDGSVRGNWRVPNVNEAFSLFDSSTGGFATGILLKNIGYPYYFIATSTINAKNTANAICLNFATITEYGRTGSCSSGNSLYAVRNPK